ncbi:MAG: thiamine-phosphate kinase [Verrucomicrobia bacterium]|nr:MAG: thiamine-phosphate kinase [Verrucomicrobiota bacterium]
MTALKKLGEREVIRRLAALLPSRPDVRAGIGHDVAVVAGNRAYDFLLKSDAVVEGRHFLPTTPPRQIGHKALGRVLSDLAAAGGEPLWALVNLVTPRGEKMSRLRAIYQGLATLARRHGLAIVGGDTTEGPALELHVFAVGRLPRGTALLRSGARPGDVVFVTDTLGGSLAGKHLRFIPRLAEGRWLRAGDWATATIDLSDGLATDLDHILEMSRVGAKIFTEKIPIAKAVFRLRPARRDYGGQVQGFEKTNSLFSKPWKKRSPLAHALGDGEDFELLFTVPCCQAVALEQAWRKKFRTRLTAIGVITRGAGKIVWLKNGTPLTLHAAGFEHFR